MIMQGIGEGCCGGHQSIPTKLLVMINILLCLLRDLEHRGPETSGLVCALPAETVCLQGQSKRKIVLRMQGPQACGRPPELPSEGGKPASK